MNKVFFIVLFCAIFFSQTVKATINIAVIAPKSGDYSDAAKDLLAGAQTAVAEINKQGGLLGHSINLIEIDDRCDNRFNVSMAQMMSVHSSAEDKIVMVVGPYCQNEFTQVADIYAKGKILQIMPLPVDGSIIGSNHKGLLKLVGDISAQADKFVNHYQHNFNNNNVALVYDDNLAYAVEIAAKVQHKFADNNWLNRLTSYTFAPYGKNYTQMAQEILLNNQVVYIIGNSKETAKLTREIGEIKNGTSIFTDRYHLQENYAEIVSSSQKGLYFLGLDELKDNPQFAETLVHLRLMGQEPKGLGVYGYLSVSLWKNLVLSAKSFQYDILAQKAATVRLGLPWGEIRFRNGNPDKSAPYGVFGFEGKEYTQVD